MKKLVFGLFFSLCLSTNIVAQVKIGENPQNLHNNSVLELESTTKALVITRVTTTQMNDMTPLNGALVYNTDTSCVYYYDGTVWVNLCETEKAENISLEETSPNTYTFTNSEGVETIFTIPTFSSNYTGNQGSNYPSGIIITETNPYNVNIEVGLIHGESIQGGSVGRNQIANTSILTRHLSDGSVSALKIGSNAVTTNKIQSGNANEVLQTNTYGIVEWGPLNANNIAGQDLTADASITLTGTPTGALLETVGISVADGGITDVKLADDAVITSKITDLNVTTGKIADDAITTDKILDATIVNADIANDAINSAKIENETIISEDILNGTIATVDVAEDAIDRTKINADVAGTGLTQNVNGSLEIDPTSITGDGDITSTDLNVTNGTDAAFNDVTIDINTGAVTSDKILDATILNIDIANNAINSAKIENETIISEDILNGTIATVDVAEDAIDRTKINADVAGTGLTQNVNGSLEIDPTSITGDGDITSTDLNVTNGTDAAFNDVTIDINTGAVTSDKILDATILNIDIANNAINSAKIENETIISEDILNGTIATVDVAEDAIDRTKINADVAGTGLTQNVNGSLEIDPTSITGDGDITSTDLNVTNGTDAAFNDVTIDINTGAVTSDKILDATIVNADINAAAAIDGSKINPVFTSNVSTTGTLTTLGTAIIGDNTITNVDGTAGQVLTTDGAGIATWEDVNTGIPTGTAGSIFFSDGSGNLVENNSQLFWDAGNNRFGIGTNTIGTGIKLRIANGAIRSERIFNSSAGNMTNPTYSFFGDEDTGMFRDNADELVLVAGGQEAIRIKEDGSSTNVTVRGAFSTRIRDINTGTTAVLEEDDHTVIFSGTTITNVTFPSTASTGQILILKNISGGVVTTDITYVNSTGTSINSLPVGVTQLQSDGTNWQQIN